MRLRTLAMGWVAGSAALGLGLAAIWGQARLEWEDHLSQARMAGVGLYATLADGLPAPARLRLVALSPEDAALAAAGDFDRLTIAPQPTFVTLASVRASAVAGISAPANTGLPMAPGGASRAWPETVSLAILSPRLNYPVARLPTPSGQTAPEKMGEVVALVARLCSDAVMVARDSAGVWQRIEGGAVWSCEAAPRDLRLPMLIAAAVGLAALLASAAASAGHFSGFAAVLRQRGRLGAPAAFAVEGPDELREIVGTVNDHLQAERDQLARRAGFLSAISHDLGTPTQRLRLRAALIDDPALRHRFEADLSQMAEMIAGVLAYSRAEAETEPARPMSLRALIEAVTADYQDTGAPVTLRSDPPRQVARGASVFSAGRAGSRALPPEDWRVVVTGRPVALRRAITNLIDNALKYGRRATVWLEADGATATVCVQDEGTTITAEALTRLSAPFERGENVGAMPGAGLGLAIVATIAGQHGGSVSFETNPTGNLARMSLTRGVPG